MIRTENRGAGGSFVAWRVCAGKWRLTVHRSGAVLRSGHSDVARRVSGGTVINRNSAGR